MLKDKSCYATESAYVRAFFLHNSEVRDFLVDPLMGSFIRVVIPSKDQPESEKWFSRPQFLFMSRYTCSRFYELDDAADFQTIFEQMKDHVRGSEITYSTGRHSRDISCDSNGTISFKDNVGKFEHFVACPPPIVKDDTFFTPERRATIVGNVVDAFRRIQNDELPKESILNLGNEMMTTIHRTDAGIRTPIVISGRKHPDRKDHFIIMGTRHSNTIQRLTFLESEESSAEAEITKYLDKVEELAEDVIVTHNKTGRFAFINEVDVNMEYVSVRLVDYIGKDGVAFVIINSDRYPANTKMSYHYTRELHQEFKTKLVSFAKQFSEM